MIWCEHIRPLEKTVEMNTIVVGRIMPGEEFMIMQTGQPRPARGVVFYQLERNKFVRDLHESQCTRNLRMLFYVMLANLNRWGGTP